MTFLAFENKRCPFSDCNARHNTMTANTYSVLFEKSKINRLKHTFQRLEVGRVKEYMQTQIT